MILLVCFINILLLCLCFRNYSWLWNIVIWGFWEWCQYTSLCECFSGWKYHYKWAACSEIGNYKHDNR